MMSSRLLNMIHAKHIQCDAHAQDWRGVVRVTGQLMQTTNLIEPHYTEAMIELIEEAGPYLVIAPGVALLHARPEDGVKQAGMVVLTLADPIPFGHSSNDPVRLVFGLAAQNNDSHIDAMAELATLLSQEGAIDALSHCASSDEMLKTMQRFTQEEG